MKVRQARKILRHPAQTKRLRCKLEKMYPPYISESGTFTMPSWHKYQLFVKAWTVIHRKQSKYGEKLKSL